MTLSPGSTAIVGWTTIGQELTWDRFPNAASIAASDGVRFLDLTGYHDSLPFGGITQTIVTTVGQNYVVSLDLGTAQQYFQTSGPISVVVSAGATTVPITYAPTGSGTQWGRFDFTFTATAATTPISIVGTAGNLYVGVDNVSVVTGAGSNLFAADGIVWHQPLARNGASEDTDPSAGGTLKYRFKSGSTIPIQIHAQGISGDVTANSNVTGKVVVFGDTDMDGVIDAGELPIDIGFNGVGGAGGIMDKIGGHLKYNLDTKKLPVTLKCYILQVTITDNSTGESRVETVALQSK